MEINEPGILTSLHNPEYELLSYENIMYNEAFQQFEISQEQCYEVGRLTRDQSMSDIWISMRQERITASKMYDICHTN